MSNVSMAGTRSLAAGSATRTDNVAPSGVLTRRSWTSLAAQPHDMSKAATSRLVRFMCLRPVECAPMSILDRILGRTPTTTPQITAQPGKAQSSAAPAPLANLPDVAISMKSTPPPTSANEPLMRVYDQFGRAVSIGRETWRKDVLLPNLAANRDKPDELYGLVVNALNDG